MRTLRLSLVGMVILVSLGGLGAGAVAQPEATPDPMAPARFTMEPVGEPRSDTTSEWTQADGYRELMASGVITFEASDPRVSGTMTMTVSGRQFVTSGVLDWGFELWVGTVRIDNADGAWVGTTEGFTSESFTDYPMLLAGEGAYDGLTAIISGHAGIDDVYGYDGVIFGHGLPPMPDPVEPSAG